MWQRKIGGLLEVHHSALGQFRTSGGQQLEALSGRRGGHLSTRKHYADEFLPRTSGRAPGGWAKWDESRVGLVQNHPSYAGPPPRAKGPQIREFTGP